LDVPDGQLGTAGDPAREPVLQADARNLLLFYRLVDGTHFVLALRNDFIEE
jgi:hypothetical protein